MAAERVAGVFADPALAGRARRDLVDMGIQAERIHLSADLTGDDVAAEAPGQSFDNQPGQNPRDSSRAKAGELVRTGACVLTVEPQSGVSRPSIEAVLKRNGGKTTRPDF
jgi:hypothetical protein